ncbi:MAG: ABC transporter ATP-binding protein [Eubacteriales bacterium]|nr:ABC transporter ATP-binding protein [Eubacteriales bacterium]
MIKVSDLHLQYGKKVVLDDISFEVKKGQTVGLLGKNGAGKSSLMNAIAGYNCPASGTILIDGIDIQKNPKQAKRKIGYLPEIPPIYKDMSVNEYLTFAAKIKGIKEYKEEVLRVVSLLNLGNNQNIWIKRLSKGTQQRVGLGAALMGNPPILILDEPLVGLDPAESKRTREIIRSLKKDHAIIISSHILKEIEELCNEIRMIKDGKLVLDSSTKQLRKHNHQNVYCLHVKGEQKKIQDCLEKFEFVTEVLCHLEIEDAVHEFVIQTKSAKDARERLFQYLVKKNFIVYEIKNQEASLEEIFMDANTKEEK